MNKIALAGGLVALVAGLFGILFMVVPKFVEVFVQLPGGLSDCSVGYLGVFKAGFDSSCLSAEDLAKTDFESVEAFESSTTDFKLLFPASTDFIREASPLYAATAAEFGEDATNVFFPAFEGECQAYYDALADQQPDLWAGAVNTLITETSAGIGLNVYGGLFNGSSPLVGGFTEVMIGTVEAALGNAGIPVASPLNTPIPGFAPTPLPLQAIMPNILAGLVAVEPVNLTSTLKTTFTTVLESILTGAGCAPVSVRDCVNGALVGQPETAGFLLPFGLNSNSSTIGTTYGATYTSLTGFTSPLDTATKAGAFAAQDFANAGIFLDINILSSETAAALATGWGAVGLLAGAAPAVVAQDAAGFVKAVTDAFPLPSSWFVEYGLCSIFQGLLVGNEITPNDIDQNPAVCSTLDLLVPPSADGNSNLVLALQAQGTDPADLASVAALSGLFGICFSDNPGNGITGPDQCGLNFFHSYILSGTYSFSILTNQSQADVQKEAVAKCEDDLKDAEAIENAQLLVPIATGAAFVACIAGIAAAVSENKVLSIVAAVVVIAGGVCSFLGLNGVRNAPVYSLVSDGGEPDDYALVYKNSTSVLFGLVNILGSFVAGVILGVSACKGGAAKEETLDADKKALV